MKATGISNRETPEEETAERREYPAIEMSSPPPEDAAGNIGEDPAFDTSGEQTSRKSGSRSSAQKAAETRYQGSSMPATRKVEGAFGREPNDSWKGETND